MITYLTRINWKKSLVLAVILFAIASLLLPDFALAQGNIVASYVEKILFSFVNTVFGTMVGLAGSLLNFSINNFVVGFGDIYKTKGLGFAIDSLWVIVRDIFNLTFIFGLVFIGLKMIFESDSSAKKLLVNLILAALFVNFSLFITKFVVDFSNIATVQIVNTFPKDKAGDPDFSGAFADSMGLSSTQKLTTETFQTKFAGGGGLGFIFGQLFIYIIATFVFMGGALLLMIRFVVLNLYMLLSPLMFLGLVFPSAAGVSKDYWKGFLGRAFFAPAYILMLYFSLKIMTSYKLILPPGQTGLAEVFTKPLELGSVLPPFILTAIFLIASLVIAQKMGAQGASGVISAGKALTGKARKYTQKKAGDTIMGGAGFAGRQIIGRGAAAVAKSPRLRSWAAGSGVGGTLTRGFQKTATSMGNSTYDARNIPGVASVLGSSKAKNTEAENGGFAERRAAADKKRNKQAITFGNSLGTIDTTSPEGKAQVAAEIQNRTANSQSKQVANAAKTALQVKEGQVHAQKTAIEADIARLEAEYQDKKQHGTVEDYEKAKQAVAEKTKGLQNLEEASGLTALKKEVETTQAKLAAEMKMIEVQAESSVMYANQIKWAQTMQAKATMWNKIGDGVGIGRRRTATAKELADYYGASGEKASANIQATEKAKKQKSDQSQIIKDLQAHLEGKDSPEPKPAKPADKA